MQTRKSQAGSSVFLVFWYDSDDQLPKPGSCVCLVNLVTLMLQCDGVPAVSHGVQQAFFWCCSGLIEAEFQENAIWFIIRLTFFLELAMWLQRSLWLCKPMMIPLLQAVIWHGFS